MKLISDQVKHVAKLANLSISEAEEKKYSKQLSKILDYIEQLNQVDTLEVEPQFNVTGLANVMRSDEYLLGLSQEEALQNAPNKKSLPAYSGKKDSFFLASKGVPFRG